MRDSNNKEQKNESKKESKLSETQKKSLAKQASKRKAITIQLSLEQYARLEEMAEDADKTIHGYVIRQLFGK